MIHHLFKIAVTFLFISFQKGEKKEYHKEYYENGTLKTEGWFQNNQKTNYWYSYHPNGTIAEQGHFKNNKKDGYWYFFNPKKILIQEGHFKNNNAENWWIIYDIAHPNKSSQITRKFQYENNQKNGYCLFYIGGKLFKAEKYKDDQKTGEWTDVSSFKRDNPNASL